VAEQLAKHSGASLSFSQEGVMAAALPAASIVPIGKPAETRIQSSDKVAQAGPQISARRRLGVLRKLPAGMSFREANLPLLTVAKELRRMKRQEDLGELIGPH
jgi:hypothetical protein